MRILDKDTIEIHVNSKRGFDNGHKIAVDIKSIIETSYATLATNPKYPKTRYFVSFSNTLITPHGFYEVKISKKEYDAINEFLASPYPFPARSVYNAIYELEINENNNA